MTTKNLCITLLILLIVGYGCGGRFSEPDGMTVFRYNEPVNITSLDPSYARNQANIWACTQLYNGLLELDGNLMVKPSVARSWDVSDDGLNYVFHLKKGVRFHDDPCFPGGTGREVTAADFVFSLKRLVDPANNSPGAWVMNQVARSDDGSLAVSALSDTVLHIRLARPFPPFLGILTMIYCSVIPQEAIMKYGADFRRNPVGTGPFRFKYWKEGVKLVMTRNDHYFESEDGVSLPYLDAVSISFIIDRQTSFLEFIKGNFDFLSAVDASYKDELLTPSGNLQPGYKDRFSLITMPFMNTEYLGIFQNAGNLPDNWPLLDKNVRQAINYGFDRKRMLTFLRNGIGTPAQAGFVPAGMPGFNDNSGGYSYNPDLARRLLEEAGFPNGEGLPQITLQTNQNYQDIAQFIQHELRKIGIRVLIDVLPSATLREAMAKGESRFFRASWIADYPDAENYLALFYSKNHAPAGPNYTHFKNDDFDKLYVRSLSLTNDSARFGLYRQMDSIVKEHAPVVFLFYDQSVRIVPGYVSGMTNNSLNQLDLRRVQVSKGDI